MQSERYDNIEYNDEWQSVPVVRAEPFTEQYEETGFDEDYDTYSNQSNDYKSFAEIVPKKKSGSPQPVIKLQFLLSIIALLTAFVLKNYGGALYTTVSNWYFDNLNNSLVVTMNTQNDMLPTEIQTEVETQNNTQPKSHLPTQPTEEYTQNPQPATETTSNEATEFFSDENITEPITEPIEEIEANNEY